MYVNIKLFSLSETGIHIDLDISECDVHVHGALFTFSCVTQSISVLSYWSFESIISDDDPIKGRCSNVINYNGYKLFADISYLRVKIVKYKNYLPLN